MPPDEMEIASYVGLLPNRFTPEEAQVVYDWTRAKMQVMAAEISLTIGQYEGEVKWHVDIDSTGAVACSLKFTIPMDQGEAVGQS